MTISTSDPNANELIRARAAELGFDVCRFADARAKWAASDRLAEFVENDETLQMLKAFGVDMVQGYHLDKPQAQHPALSGGFPSG